MNKPLLDEALVRTHPVIFSSKEPSPGLERRFSEYMYDFEKKLGKASDTLFLNLKEKEGDPMLIFLIKRLIEKYELSDKQVSKIIYLQHSSIDNLTDRESYYQEISEKGCTSPMHQASSLVIGDIMNKIEKDSIYALITNISTMSDEDDFIASNTIIANQGSIGPFGNYRLYMKINDVLGKRNRVFGRTQKEGNDQLRGRTLHRYDYADMEITNSSFDTYTY